MGQPGDRRDRRVPGELQAFDEEAFERFLSKGATRPKKCHPAVSLFSAGGIGDYGYRLAGFTFMAHAELDPMRLALCKANHKRSADVAGDLTTTWPDVVEAYNRVARNARPALLTGMSPCQGLSSASAYDRVGQAGKPSDDPRNLLPFVITKVAKALKPRIVVVENVPGILDTTVVHPDSGKQDNIASLLADDLPDYTVFPVTVQFADFGVPQRRRRTLLTFIRNDESCLAPLRKAAKVPYPARTHDVKARNGLLPWVTSTKFLHGRYEALNSQSKALAYDAKDSLHFVPVYDRERYDLVRLIPPWSGKSAYQTDVCPHCSETGHDAKAATCRNCRNPLHSRPIVVESDGTARLIKGHNTSYKRMPPHLPVSAITTANGHLGSDSKIHPWQNRLLSPRETADAQTIPRTYNWAPGGKQPRLETIRHVIGEAIPAWFTYLHGQALRSLLLKGHLAVPYLMPATDTRVAELRSDAD